MDISSAVITQAIEIAKAAIGSGEKSGLEALNYPDKVSKLIDTAARKIQQLATEK
jgi:hypothetical protein